jgi:hypothetical protein
VQFEHFNAFFYRELLPSARPVTAAGDDSVVVSPADSRMVVYETVLEAAKIWIKGATFTIESLLGAACADVAPLFFGGSLCLARLAPQVRLVKRVTCVNFAIPSTTPNSLMLCRTITGTYFHKKTLADTSRSLDHHACFAGGICQCLGSLFAVIQLMALCIP